MTASSIERLEQAARDRDWPLARSATEELLSLLSRADAFELARRELMRRLPAFEAHHAGVRWPREYLEGRLHHVEPVDDFDGPGANNFVCGVQDLDQAAHAAGDHERTTFLVDAISEAIMSEIAGSWGSRFPERWRRWYADAATGAEPQDPFALSAMKHDPMCNQLELEAWLAVARELARLIAG